MLRFRFLFLTRFLVSLALMIGCKGPASHPVIADPIEVKESEPRELTPEETFSKLKALFPHRMLDENFQTLQALTATRTYLDFLSQEYPTAEAFQTYDVFLETAPPDSQRYLPFLQERLENPTDEDITTFHYITQGLRNANALQHHLVFDPNPAAFGNMHTVMEKRTTLLENKEVQKWFERHFRAGEMPPLVFVEKVMIPIENFVIETEKADAGRIQDLFDEHGKDDGMIWLAVLEPTLPGEIINNFTNVEVFVNWVKGDFFPDQPLEVPQEAINFLQ